MKSGSPRASGSRATISAVMSAPCSKRAAHWRLSRWLRHSRRPAAVPPPANRPRTAAKRWPVNVVRIEPLELRREVEAVGTLAARDETVVSAEVEARVARLAADMGDRVAANAPLVILDGEKHRYRVDEQRAVLEQTRARLGASGTDLPTAEQTPDVVSALAQRTEAEQRLARAQQLADEEPAPRSGARARADRARNGHGRPPDGARGRAQPPGGGHGARSGAQQRESRPAGHGDPRAVRRRRRRAPRLARPVRARPDAGDAPRSSAPAAPDGRDPGTVRSGDPGRAHALRFASMPIRIGRSRGASPASAPTSTSSRERSASKAKCPTRTAQLKPGHVRPRPHRDGSRRQDRRRPGHRRADALRPQCRLHRQRRQDRGIRGQARRPARCECRDPGGRRIRAPRSWPTASKASATVCT